MIEAIIVLSVIIIVILVGFRIIYLKQEEETQYWYNQYMALSGLRSSRSSNAVVDRTKPSKYPLIRGKIIKG